MADAAPSLRKGSAYALLGVIAQGGFRVAVSVIIGRVAGAAVLAHAAGLLATAQLLTLAGPTSLAAAQTRYVARATAHTSAENMAGLAVVRYVRRATLVVASLTCTCAAAVWAIVVDAGTHSTVVLVFVAAGLVAYLLAKSHVLAVGKVRRQAWSEIGTSILGLTATALLVKAGVRDIGLLWPVGLTAWTCAALTWMPARGGSLRPADRREINLFALIGVAGTLVSAGFMQASVLVATWALPELEAGNYAAAFFLATPLSLVTTAVGMVLFPAFARVSDGERTGMLLKTAMQAMHAVIIPPACALMFLSPELAAFVWGRQFELSAQALPILLCAIGMAGSGLASSQALTARGVNGMRDSLAIGSIGASAGIIIWLVAVPASGGLGIAIGYAVGTAMTSCLPLLRMSRRLGLTVSREVTIGWIVPATAASVSVLFIQAEAQNWVRIVAASACVTWWVLALARGLRKR